MTDTTSNVVDFVRFDPHVAEVDAARRMFQPIQRGPLVAGAGGASNNAGSATVTPDGTSPIRVATKDTRYASPASHTHRFGRWRSERPGTCRQTVAPMTNDPPWLPGLFRLRDMPDLPDKV